MKEDDDCRELQVWCGNVAAVAQDADDQSFSAVVVCGGFWCFIGLGEGKGNWERTRQ